MPRWCFVCADVAENSLEFRAASTPNSDPRLFFKPCFVAGSDVKRLFPCSFPQWYQRLNGKRADQALSERDKLINVSQFIIGASCSPCQVANGNINHRLPHHDPSHILAPRLASVDFFSPKIPSRPKQICLEQMSNTIQLRSKHPQTRLTCRAPLLRPRLSPQLPFGRCFGFVVFRFGLFGGAQ